MDIKVVELIISWNLEAMQKFDESNVMDIEYIYIPPQPHPTPTPRYSLEKWMTLKLYILPVCKFWISGKFL